MRAVEIVPMCRPPRVLTELTESSPAASQAFTRLGDHSSEVGPQRLHVLIPVRSISDAVSSRSLGHALIPVRRVSSTSASRIVGQFRRDSCGHRKRRSIKRPGRHGVTRSVPPARIQRADARSENRGGAPRALLLVFGGPLLGDPDRQQRTAAGSPTGDAARKATVSPTTRRLVHFGNTPTRPRYASRARVRARAVGRPLPIARPALVASLRHPSALPAKRLCRSLCWPRT
jgi:hypothetical protein